MMTAKYDRWKSKARSLAKLAEDQRGKPEGDLARQKLLEIINNHPEARDYQPIKDLIERELTLQDIAFMRHNGIYTDGSWTGGDLQEAIAVMEIDYKRRIQEFKERVPKPQLVDSI